MILKLGKLLVIKNLGCPILLGQPQLIANKISISPHRRRVLVETVDPPLHISYPPERKMTKNKEHEILRVPETTVLYPGQILRISTPESMKSENMLMISSSSKHCDQWLGAQLVPNRKGLLNIVNPTSEIISLKKSQHIGDIRTCEEIQHEDLFSLSKIRRIHNLDEIDWNKYQGVPAPADLEEDLLSLVQIDPGHQLPSEIREQFKETVLEYPDVLTKWPGLYNSFFGRVDTDINFSQVPPACTRAFKPNLSKEMTLIMAKKMDELEKWGVLRKPEDLGLTVEYILASMLVPKKTMKGDVDEKNLSLNDWRFVTNFAPLNQFIKKLETASETIEESKRKLAAHKFHVSMDLSNTYFQAGVGRQSSQYMGVIHPMRGLTVYSVTAMGMKNSAEQLDEMLARTFGEMKYHDKITTNADAIIPLANTPQQLLENFRETLQRARLAGLTFKPQETIIAPVTSKLWGWELRPDGWKPSVHKTNPLSVAPEPKTVKGVRSFLGAYKQLAATIPDYAVKLGPLEDVQAGRASAEKIVWTKELSEVLKKVKQSIQKVKIITVPRPDDELHSFSDASLDSKSIGGRLEVWRMVDGKTKKFHGGHYSLRLNKFQTKWTACELEAKSVEKVMSEFEPLFKQSKKKSYHHMASLPVKYAWNKARRGELSSSARVAAFLSSIARMSVELVYTPGPQLLQSDYTSRNPVECPDASCQICRFARQEEKREMS